MIKRFDRLDVATADLADAVSVYEHNFNFSVQRTGNPDEAVIKLGDAQIRLRSGAAAAAQLSISGEGLAAIWLEADDVDRVAEELKKAGVIVGPIRVEDNRRFVAVTPASANMVPLFIFDRR
jgi:predicted enzyme related to lactoylglutathione lyase